ncbi:MAG: ATP-binding protein, partial [SAR324 cluster bacterium]|nr:ATP-binding protein [SAR324 cluster bacterium]
FARDWVLIEAGMLSQLIVPLMVDGEVIGVFNFAGRKANYYDEEDLEAAQAVVDAIALSLNRFQARQEMESIQEISLAIQSQQDLDEILEMVLEHIRSQGYDRVRLYLYDEAQHAMVGMKQVGLEQDIEFVSSVHPLETESYSVQPLTCDSPQIKRVETQEHMQVVSEYEKINGFSISKSREFCDIPLKINEAGREILVGQITFDNEISKVPLDQVRVDRLKVYASQAAIAIRHAQLYRHMAEQVQSRTEALRKKAAELERSNQSLQDFANVASHDLQEPLRKIQVFGDLLETEYSRELDDQGKYFIERMRDAASRMQEFIQDLLAFSRVNSQTRPFSSVDLDKVMQVVVSDLEVQIQETDGQVVWEGLPALEADPGQMKQLLQNLVSNALKFHRDGEKPQVRICSKSCGGESPDDVSSGEGMCQLFVADNGIGFEEKYLDRIFSAFERLHDRRTYGGTGMGLTISQRIVERHGGSITARSVSGQGSTFILTLPIRQPDLASEEKRR